MECMRDIGGKRANLTKLALMQYLIRLFMSVNCCLNDKNFAITVLNNKQTYKPDFHCICDGKDSGTQQSASAAINNTYRQVFNNKTEYSGIAVMGFDDEVIVHELFSDILFVPIYIHLD